MIDAIYCGLLYGLIAGFGAVGFALTLFFIWGLIDGVTYIIELINGGNSDEWRGPRS